MELQREKAVEKRRSCSSTALNCQTYCRIKVSAEVALPPMLEVTIRGVAGGTAGSGAPTRVRV